MGVIPNPKMAFIFPISCILALIFPILINYFPKCVGKGSFPKSQIKSLKYAIVFASKQLRMTRLRKYPIDPKAYLGRCKGGSTDPIFKR